MNHLSHCIYTSAATHTFDALELAEMLRRARENNDRLCLTGMLLYTQGSFFQVLEGSPEVVEAMFSRIAHDERHQQVTKIISEPIPRRSFTDWTMGFQDISREELADIPDMNDFFGASRCFTDLDAGRAKKLLAAFRDGRWRKQLSGARDVVSA